MPRPKPKSSKVRHKLSNGYLEALRDFGEGETIVRWDTDVRQLRVIVGPRKTPGGVRPRNQSAAAGHMASRHMH
jgi:hypothetical protein